MADDAPAWKVDGPGIREDTTLHPAGSGLLTQMVVPYVITGGPAKGTRHEVRVSPADFTGETVRQAITEHANSVHQVAGLESGGA